MNPRILSLTALALAGALTAQGYNCQLLGRHNLHAPYNDVWGYVAPNGKEYALLGATTGLVVVDCTNPANPVERGFFPWATSTWRDIRTYGTYAYVSSEGGGGFQIIDLTNADAPVNLGIFGSQYFGNAHNICIDTGTGRIYMVGCNTGTPVFDAAANPTNPPFLGYATGSGNSNYFHDLCVENGYGYGSMIYNGVLRIMNMSAVTPTTLSNTTTPAAFTHNAWPNAAGTLCVTTDERAGGVVKFFDTTNKSAPIARGQFTPDPLSIPHNAFIKDNLCHVSWYTEGYQCLDVTDPNNPVQVAAYDTYAGPPGTYNGAWGVYPFQPSGNIYVSDISTGLYIVKPLLTDMTITHAPLGDTLDEDGPYRVVATIQGSHPLQSITLSHRTVGGTFTTLPMTPTGTPGEYAASIPGVDAVATVEYHIDAVDSEAPRRSPARGEHSFIVGSVARLWLDDFETDRGWTHGFTTSTDDWQRGVPAGRSGTSGGLGWSDPPVAYSGSNIWGNDLGGAGFNGSYPNSVGNWLASPAIPTQGTQGLRLRFQRWLSIASGDSARLWVNNSLIWSSNTGVNDTAWTAIDYDIAAIANNATQLTIKFELFTNTTVVAGGWNIDDVELVAYSDAVPPRFYGAATPGTGALAPAIALTGSARLGATPSVDATDLLGSTPALLVVNVFDDNVTALGCTFLVSLSNALTYGQTSTAGGTASFAFPIPNDPTLDNVYLYSQVLALDAGSPGGILSATQGMRFRIHAR